MSSLTALESARRTVVALVAGGVRWVVFSPGSRNAPLVYAASTTGVRTLVRIDERSAAFTALGIAVATGEPVALVCTSGTAAGNFLPAVMEASHVGAPLIVVTADRPARLHGTGANQTTDQSRLYGAHVRVSRTVASGVDPRGALHEALCGARGSGEEAGGPVHVNLAFEEPLTPHGGDDVGSRADTAGGDDGVGLEAAPLPEPAAGSSGFAAAMVDARQLPARRTVVVAGHHAGAEAELFARQGGFPLLAEPSSGARRGPNAIGPYQLLLPHFMERIERVVLFGKPTLSRPVNALLTSTGVPAALYAPEPLPWCEPGRRGERVVRDAEQLALFAGTAAPGWLAEWQGVARRVEGLLERELGGTLMGLSVARAVWARTDGVLFLGSSTPIRDVDIAGVPRARAPRVFANRGLAGIDGVVSTAVGVSVGAQAPVRALLGDVTFLHDVGGLLVPSMEEGVDVQVVVVNDAGGGIFGLLEHGGLPERYAGTVERFFGTPHGVQFSALAAAYGWSHQLVGSLGELEAALSEGPVGPVVLEVPVDRRGARAFRERLRVAVARELGAQRAGSGSCSWLMGL